MNGITKRTIQRSLMAVVLVSVVTLAVSSTGGTAAIKERHEAMERIGESIGALARIAKKEAPFDAEVVEKNAATIADELKKASKLFPEGSEEGDVETWAKAEIWSDRAGFDHSLQETHAAAVALQSVTDESQFAPALGKLGNGCKGCHEKYRRPKQ